MRHDVEHHVVGGAHGFLADAGEVVDAESRAEDTPEQILIEQLGFAPSQIIPVRLAIMFFTAWQTRVKSPPIK